MSVSSGNYVILELVDLIGVVAHEPKRHIAPTTQEAANGSCGVVVVYVLRWADAAGFT